MLQILYVIGAFILGISGFPMWTIPLAAVAGVAAYHSIRPQIWQHYTELRYARAWGAITKLLVSLFVIQLIVTGVLYGAGRLFGHFVWPGN